MENYITSNVIIMFASILVLSVACASVLRFFGTGMRNFVVYAASANFIFAAGVVFFFLATGSFYLRSSTEIMEAVNLAHSGSFFRLSVALFAVALFIQMVLVPVPSFLMVLFRAFVLLVFLRIFVPIASLWGGFFEVPFIALGLAVAFLGNILALRRGNVIDMLMDSSVAYIGYVFLLLPLVLLDEKGGVTAAAAFFITFIAAYLGAFLAVRPLVKGRREGAGLDDIEGMARAHPIVAFVLSFFMFALMGVVPLTGFFARFFMLRGFVMGGNYILLALVGVNFAIMAYYFIRVVGKLYTFRREKVADDAEVELGYPSVVVITFCTFVLVYLGLKPAVLVSWFFN